MKIELVYVQVDCEFIQHLQVQANSTIEDVVRCSDLLKQCPYLSLSSLDVGIYSTAASLQTIVKDGDRVEVYRDLQMNPMEARRLRAQV